MPHGALGPAQGRNAEMAHANYRLLWNGRHVASWHLSDMTPCPLDVCFQG